MIVKNPIILTNLESVDFVTTKGGKNGNMEKLSVSIPSTIEVVHEGPKLLLKTKNMVKLCHELLLKLEQETVSTSVQRFLSTS